MCFCKHEAGRHLEPFGPRQVLVLAKLFLQFQQLLTCECRAGSPSLAHEGMMGTCNMDRLFSESLGLSFGEVLGLFKPTLDQRVSLN